LIFFFGGDLAINLEWKLLLASLHDVACARMTKFSSGMDEPNASFTRSSMKTDLKFNLVYQSRQL
jgi:hypothetical protein